MSVQQYTRGRASFGGLVVAGSAAVGKQVVTGVSVNPASIAAGAAGDHAATVTGARVGDFVVARPPADLEAGLLVQGARVTAADTVTIRIVNQSGVSVDGVAKNWDFLLLR